MGKPLHSSFCDVLAWLGRAAAEGNLRSEPRVSVCAPVMLVTGIDGFKNAAFHHSAETRDITPGGMCVVAAWQPKTGDTCQVELPTNAAASDEGSPPKPPTTFRCRVCYSTPLGEGTYRTGLAFLAAA
jgi:hypothetical protein